MTSPGRSASRAAVAIALFVVLAGPAISRAGTLPDPVPIEGIPAGPFYFTPSIAASESIETNPFYQTTPQGDYVTRVNPRVGVILPFSHSYVRALYDGVFRRYHQLDVTNSDSRDLAAELSLLFGTSDRLVLLGTQTAGASEVLRFDGGEATYDATPFHYGTYTAGVQRIVPGHLGYEVAGTWSRLTFDESNASFFDFDGYDVAADVNVPASSYIWFVAGAGIRRFDHMLANDPTHAVFRREEANLARFGVRGVLGSRGTYHAILAYDESVYPGGAGSDFRGIVLDGELAFSPGPATNVSVTAGRRPWSSFYGDNNYYLSNTLSGSVQHTFSDQVTVGANVLVGASAYADPFDVATGGPRRHDRDLEAGAYVEIPFPHKCALRATYDLKLRRTNVEVSYTSQFMGLQFVAGWR